MAINIKIDAHINVKKLTKQIEAIKNDKVMYEIHNKFAKNCDPYVPMDTGTLAESALRGVYKDKVVWAGPYAHYMYMGELYLAPNGSSWAKKDEKKYPSGRPLQYSKEKHMLATKEWDKAMMAGPRRKIFLKEAKEVILDRFKELYG